MTLPSLHPYPCRLKALPEARIYEFVDDKNRTYFITLTTYDFPEQPLNDHGVVLGLELQNPTARDDGQDIRLEATMVAVVEQELTQYPSTIILWVCSPDKKQQRARNKLFNRWYKHYKDTDGLLTIIKKDVETNPNEYASLLYRADHPDRKELEELLLSDLDKL